MAQSSQLQPVRMKTRNNTLVYAVYCFTVLYVKQINTTQFFVHPTSYQFSSKRYMCDVVERKTSKNLLFGCIPQTKSDYSSPICVGFIYCSNKVNSVLLSSQYFLSFFNFGFTRAMLLIFSSQRQSTI